MLDASVRLVLKAAHRARRLWRRVRRPSIRSAWVAVWWSDELLVIRNSYRSGETLPSGGVGWRETPRAAARRELEEEVGLRAAEESLVPAFDRVADIDGARDHVHIFELFPTESPRVRVDRREVVWAAFVPRPALGDLALPEVVFMYLAARDHQTGSRERGQVAEGVAVDDEEVGG